ncbi:MAG TPA: signal peptidase I, partial [Firmicutes bacterium]|nr:signal peptidase I [Bacillota bacterium]
MILSQKFARTLCLVLAVFFLLVLLVQGGLALQGLFTRYRLFSVISGSMEPALPVGCIIVIDTEKSRLYAPGEIITYRQGEEYITHRVAELGYDGGFFYRTRGDANMYADNDPVAHRAVVGRVVLALPLSPSAALHSLRTIFPVLAALLVAAFFTHRLRRRRRAGRVAV